MNFFSEGKTGRNSRQLYFLSRQNGRIEVGSVLVILVILGVIAYMAITGTTWGDLSVFGKALIVGAVVVSVVGARMFNESAKWPNANLSGASKTAEKGSAAESDKKVP